jgi:hypothetical protein
MVRTISGSTWAFVDEVTVTNYHILAKNSLLYVGSSLKLTQATLSSFLKEDMFQRF